MLPTLEVCTAPSSNCFAKHSFEATSYLPKRRLNESVTFEFIKTTISLAYFRLACLPFDVRIKTERS